MVQFRLLFMFCFVLWSFLQVRLSLDLGVTRDDVALDTAFVSSLENVEIPSERSPVRVPYTANQKENKEETKAGKKAEKKLRKQEKKEDKKNSKKDSKAI